MSKLVRQFSYVVRDPALGKASLAPILPITLSAGQSLTAEALVDTGAAINVLPNRVGLQLGLNWNQCTQSVELTGNLALMEARVVVVSAMVGNFTPVRMAFAWASADLPFVILGQVNFFLEFDVCFFRSREVFEVREKA